MQLWCLGFWNWGFGQNTGEEKYNTAQHVQIPENIGGMTEVKRQN